MQLTESQKDQITKSFVNILHKKLDNCSNDSYYEQNRAEMIAREEFKEKFDDYNNSTWIDPESQDYDQDKEDIIEFMRSL